MKKLLLFRRFPWNREVRREEERVIERYGERKGGRLEKKKSVEVGKIFEKKNLGDDICANNQ